MNQNAEAIIVFCSYLCIGKDVRPLDSREWEKLARWLAANEMEPKNLLEFTRADFYEKLQCSTAQADRLLRLIGRSASLSFEVGSYENMGVQLVTRADGTYPKELKKKLRIAYPPIFYCAGNLELLEDPTVGYVGSRAVEAQDVEFTARTVQKTLERGFSVVSGGAKGVDSAAETEALRQGGRAVVFLADSLMQRLKKRYVLEAVQEGRLLLLSAVKPDAGFQTRIAMERNRLIYSQSSGTVAVRSELNKGGTWAGATECLKHGWCPVFCWNHPKYAGNAALIKKGAIPIDTSWDGDVLKLPAPPAPQEEVGEQITFFDN